jgi:hypothetical protein
MIIWLDKAPARGDPEELPAGGGPLRQNPARIGQANVIQGFHLAVSSVIAKYCRNHACRRA